LEEVLQVCQGRANNTEESGFIRRNSNKVVAIAQIGYVDSKITPSKGTCKIQVGICIV
jgi:hypothetical protein